MRSCTLPTARPWEDGKIFGNASRTCMKMDISMYILDDTLIRMDKLGKKGGFFKGCEVLDVQEERVTAKCGFHEMERYITFEIRQVPE